MGAVEGIYAFIYCTKWRSGQVSRMPYGRTHWSVCQQTLKDSATQLLTKYKSGALVTQWNGGAARYCEFETSWVSGRASLISWRRIWDLANLWNRTGWKRIRLHNRLHNAIVQVFRASPPTSKTKLVLRHAKPNPLFPAPRTAWSCPRWTTGGTGEMLERVKA